MKYINILVVCFLIFSFSCKSKESKTKILAKVGNTYITEDYLNEKVMEIGEFDYLKTRIGKKQFLDVLINEQLVKIASENSDIKGSKEYKENVAKIENELKKRMEEYRNVILAKMWLEKLRNTELKTTDVEIEKFIKENPYSVSFDQVITTDYETAQSIISEMKRGVSVESIAQKYKDNDSVVVNKLPPVIKGELMGELEDVVFKMKIGEIGGIIKTKLGYHIIKKNSQNVYLTASNPQAKERVRRVLEKKKFDDYISKLQSKYKVEVVDEEYK
ncbi:MAG: peptidylprolyl isomerase [Elusimicrobiota bacterium]